MKPSGRICVPWNLVRYLHLKKMWFVLVFQLVEIILVSREELSLEWKFSVMHTLQWNFWLYRLELCILSVDYVMGYKCVCLSMIFELFNKPLVPVILLSSFQKFEN